MTVPVERTNAVKWTEDFLLELVDPKKTPRIPKSIRQKALRCLRHYPSKFHMDIIAEREDANPDNNLGFKPKVFGKNFI